MIPTVKCSKCGNIYTGWALQYSHQKCNCNAPLIYIRKYEDFDNRKIWVNEKIFSVVSP